MSEEDAKARISDSVSRETLRRLEVYVSDLTRWQRTINLISPTTLPQIWQRHILDSAQVFTSCDRRSGTWLDLGSGGGLPGMVCAAIAYEKSPDLRFTLVESDVRKAAFLRETARKLKLSIAVVSRRIEDLPAQNADVISARALAPLPKLLALAHPHLAPNGICLFLKGVSHMEEVEIARRGWHMDVSPRPSETSDASALLKIENLTPNA